MTGTLDQIAVQKLTALADIITPWAVRTAATLRLADMLGPGPRSVADLATQTGAGSDALRRLLRHLAHHELFHEIGPDLFAVTDTGGVLASDHPSGLRAWLDASGAGARMDQAFAGLPESVLTGAPAYRTIFGRPFWADLASRPELSASFDALLAHQSAALSAEIAAGYDWSRVDHLVDVGGGTGSLLAGILRARPMVRGTLVDLPHVVGGAPALFAAAGVAPRASTIGCSILDAGCLPPNAGVYLLCSVLHDWDDSEAAKILGHCAQAAGPHGRILICERVSPDTHPLPAGSEPVTAMDLRMLVIVGGRERTLPEYRALAAHSGIAAVSTRLLPSGRTLVELADTAQGPALND